MQIQQVVINEFRRLYLQKYKRQYSLGKQKTVLAAILILNILTKKIYLISMATGTKSLPMSAIKGKQNQLLSDMHAEVLARRAFIKFLIKYKDNEIDQQIPTGLFVLDQKRKKLGINKKQFELVLYVSEIPCGDCCIDFQTENYSGSKPLSQLFKVYLPQTKYAKHILRTKPGRLDLPITKRSCSLSCSDKIMSWNVVGIQGNRMFNYYRPIYIDRIIIENNSISPQSIKSAISIKDRAFHLFNMIASKLERKLFCIKINDQIKKFTHTFRIHEPQVEIVPTKFNQKLSTKKNAQVSLIYCYGERVEECNGHTGIKHGSSLKKLTNGIGLSDYCSEKLYKNVSLSESNYQYHEIKSRIKLLFGEWTNKRLIPNLI